MSIQIYNTLQRKKEKFLPQIDNKVSMYVCGPTVYDSIHIGNARAAVVFDMVRRYFEYKGYEVNYVSNFTDVDDKIINKAFFEGVESIDIANRYIKEISQEFKALGIEEATSTPRVTEEMPEIIEMIKTLIEKGYAYEVKGHVYFDTSKKKDYGKLSGHDLNSLEAGARVMVGDLKRNPADFVLWKPSKEGEPFWSSPWGNGRPGWHIECSVMSKKYIGDTVDIHAGGDDLVFPHHENEIAQSEAANGKEFVRYWMHNGMLTVDNEKMSKSLDNFFFLSEITKKYAYDVIRYFFLSVHYRSPMDFTDELLEAAKAGLARLYNGLETAKENSEKNKEITKEGIVDENAMLIELDGFRDRFEKAMDDDFNTAAALASMHDLASFIFTHTEASSKVLTHAYQELYEFMDIFGLLDAESAVLSEEKEKEVVRLLSKREKARENKDYEASDRIRDELLAMGVEIKDTKEGTKWVYHG